MYLYFPLLQVGQVCMSNRVAQTVMKTEQNDILCKCLKLLTDSIYISADYAILRRYNLSQITNNSKERKKKLLGMFYKTSLLLECTFGLLGHHQEYK
jgi:hypothetical protein